MTGYDLTDEAAEDIREIVRYTLQTWGRAQVTRYRASLKQCLNRLAEAPGLGKSFSDELPEVRAFHCRHHFIFYLQREKPLVIAVLHERQNLAAKLAMRLDE